MLDQLDQVVQEVLSDGRHVTPAEVQGDFETLREAIVARGWGSRKPVGARSFGWTVGVSGGVVTAAIAPT